jgi:hypothetical protein
MADQPMHVLEHNLCNDILWAIASGDRVALSKMVGKSASSRSLYAEGGCRVLQMMIDHSFHLMQRCDGCRSWIDHTCTAQGRDKPMTVFPLDSPDNTTWLETAPDFCCILWEEKNAGH